MTRSANPNRNVKGPCEAGYARWGADDRLVVTKCERPGRWREYGLMPFGTVLCDDCYVSMLLARKEKEGGTEQVG